MKMMMMVVTLDLSSSLSPTSSAEARPAFNFYLLHKKIMKMKSSQVSLS